MSVAKLVALMATRVGTWTPAQLGSNVILWADASNPAYLTLDGSNKVTLWSDRSGNGHDLSPTANGVTTNKLPYSATGAFGVNKPAVVWDGTDADLATSATNLSWQQVAIVGAYTNGATSWSAGNQGLWSLASEIGLVGGSGANWNGGGTSNYPFLAQNGAAEAADSANVTALPMTSPSIEISRASGITSSSRFILGRDRNFASRQWVGPICEVLVLHTGLSDADRQKLEGYLAWRWGIASKLPTNHPYKLGPP